VCIIDNVNSGSARPRRPRSPTESLGRALSRCGALVPAELDGALRSGRVTLNGAPVRQPMTLVRETDRREAISEPLRRIGWHAIGRLDLETTGLLLFTNDEHLVAHATSPDSELPKRYVAQVQGTPDEAALEPLREGLRLGTEHLKAACARVLAPHVVELTLTQGRFHQVKRMLGAIGLPVRALHRESVGAVRVEGPPGSARLLTDEEVERDLGYPPRQFPAWRGVTNPKDHRIEGLRPKRQKRRH
jgi:pseudouridine synthase